MHSFLRKLKLNDVVDCVYYANYKYSDVYLPKIAGNGNKFVILRIKDASLENNELATVFYFYKNHYDISFFQENYAGRTAYLKIVGRCFGSYPDIKIYSNLIVPANKESGIIFDTSDIFAFSDYYKNKMLSFGGLTGVALRHTSSDVFQDLYDIISVGSKLNYKRVFNSPYDKYQINVFIKDIDETFNIPAYLTPTMAKLIDTGYMFEIVVTDIIPRDESINRNAGIRVTIKGIR